MYFKLIFPNLNSSSCIGTEYIVLIDNQKKEVKCDLAIHFGITCFNIDVLSTGKPITAKENHIHQQGPSFKIKLNYSLHDRSNFLCSQKLKKTFVAWEESKKYRLQTDAERHSEKRKKFFK